MAKTAKTTSKELVLVGEVSPSDVIRGLEKKYAEMERIASTPWKTSVPIELGFTGAVKDQKNNENLARMLSTLLVRKEAYERVMETPEADGGFGAGDKYPVFKHAGHTYEEWHHDIILRKKINNQEEEKKELKQYIEEMKEFISKDERKADLLKRLTKRFGAELPVLEA